MRIVWELTEEDKEKYREAFQKVADFRHSLEELSARLAEVEKQLAALAQQVGILTCFS